MIMVRLLPATKRLKQVIKAHGEVWRVKALDLVPCFGGKRGVFIESTDKAHTRWVLPEQVKPIHTRRLDIEMDEVWALPRKAPK